MDWVDRELTELRKQALYRKRRRLQSAQGTRIRMGGRVCVNFASNDYLNLAADPRLARASARAARRYGCGAGASPLISGHLPPLRRLEQALAKWEGADGALVFSSGYTANLAVIGAATAGRSVEVFSDALNHASLIDGCRLSRANVQIYRHADANHLEEMLRQSTATHRLIVTDTVFSMDGDLAPLPELADLARRYDCQLVLDEAHATGILGAQGRGLAEVQSEAIAGLEVIRVGTLSKALGTQGGFVCGPRQFITWLVNRARPYIFSTALAPPTAAAAAAAVAIVAAEAEPRQRLLALAEDLRSRLADLGLPPTGSRTQIVPVMVGDSAMAVRLSRRLQRAGFLVPAIRPPSVPEGTARLRISLTAGHTTADVERLIDLLREHLSLVAG
jgi:8-amino-7-oxononanoate synthase